METITTEQVAEMKRHRDHLAEHHALFPTGENALAPEQLRELQELNRRLEQHRADQIAAWPELHEVADGGRVEPGGTVDLTPIWDNRLRHSPDDASAVDLLADEAGGLAVRLAAGLQSLRQRRDGNLGVHLDAESGDQGTVTVTVWSVIGCFSDRAWWARATLLVREDQWGELRLIPEGEAVMAVRGTGGVTVYRDRRGVLGDAVATWWRGWEAREGIRGRIGSRCYLERETPVSLEEWQAATDAA